MTTVETSHDDTATTAPDAPVATPPGATPWTDPPTRDAALDALGLLAAALRGGDVALVWPGASGEDGHCLHVGRTPDPRQLARWLQMAATRPQDADAFDADGFGVVAVELAGHVATLAARGGSGVHRQDVLTLASSTGRVMKGTAARAHSARPRARAFEALVQIGTQIQAQEVHADSVFELIVEHARDLLRTDVAWLSLLDDTGRRVRLKVASGASAPDFMQMEVEVGAGIGGLALAEGHAIAVRQALTAKGMSTAISAALRSEGVRSILCAPMSQGDAMVGALYVASREEVDFGEEATSLVSALAAQAAVTIENARLYRELSDKHEALEQSFAIHRMLTDASLSGAGLNAVAMELTRLLECDLELVVTTATPRAVVYGQTGPPEPLESPDAEQLSEGELEREHVVPITAGATMLGSLRPTDSRRLDALQRRALEHGATVIALELVKQQAQLEVEWRLQAELLDELVRCEGPLPESLRARAVRAGTDLGRPRCVAVLEPVGDARGPSLLETTRRALRSRPELDGLIAPRGDRVLVAIPVDDHGHARSAIAELQNRARLAGVPTSCGMSRPRHELAVALREADAALGLARQNHGQLVSYEDLGPLRFLLDAPDTQEMASLVSELLGPLMTHDRERGSDLLATLRAYLDNGGHHPSTCAACHIHVSTLKYRLSRIATILGRPLKDPQTRFQLTLAFEILRVLEMADARVTA